MAIILELGVHSFTQQNARSFGIQAFKRASFFALLTVSTAASDCRTKVRPPTPIELELLKSPDALVLFVAQPSRTAAANVLAQPASQLMDEPILARLAFGVLCEPNDAQAGRFRASIRGNALSHLAQILASSTPDVIDELIRRTQNSSDWAEGISSLETRLESALAKLPIALIAAIVPISDPAVFQNLGETKRAVALENTRWLNVQMCLRCCVRCGNEQACAVLG